MSINNISMYNYINAAYLAKLTYEISLSCQSFKNLSFENLSLCAYAHVLHTKASAITATRNEPPTEAECPPTTKLTTTTAKASTASKESQLPSKARSHINDINTVDSKVGKIKQMFL